MKKMTLKQHQIEENKFSYQVMLVVNDVVPHVGSLLSERQANKYCRDNQWTVTIKPE